MPYGELANSWPNLEWWLAVNPGLPIEGYLPAWFVAQLSRGDLRLPTRGPGRNQSGGPSKIQDLHAAAVAANAAAAQKQETVGRPGGPATTPEPLASRGRSYPQYPVSAPPVGRSVLRFPAGSFLPSYLAKSGFGSNVSTCDGPPFK